MKIVFNKIVLYYYALLLFVFYYFLILNSGYFPKIGFVAIATVTIIGLMFMKYVARHKLFYAWLMYFIILFLNYYGGDQYFKITKFLAEAIQFLLVIILASVFIAIPKYQNYIQKFSIFALAATTLICFLTLPQLISNPSLYRAKELLSEEIGIEDSYKWLANYSMIHGIVMLFPIIVFVVKSAKFTMLTRVGFATAGVILFGVIFLSNATTPLFLALFTIILSIFLRPSKDYKISSIVLWFFLAPLIGLVFIEFYMNDLLLFIQGFYSPASSNYKKIDNIVTYGFGYSPRQYYYMVSVRGFEANPFLGTNNAAEVGMHSFFIDRLAALGILGFSILIILIFSIFTFIYLSLKITRIYFLVGFLCTLIMWLFKNVINFEMIFYPITILPGLCLFAEHKLKKA